MTFEKSEKVDGDQIILVFGNTSYSDLSAGQQGCGGASSEVRCLAYDQSSHKSHHASISRTRNKPEDV